MLRVRFEHLVHCTILAPKRIEELVNALHLQVIALLEQRFDRQEEWSLSSRHHVEPRQWPDYWREKKAHQT